MDETPEALITRLESLAEAFQHAKRLDDRAAAKAGANALKILVGMGVRTRLDLMRLMREVPPSDR